MRPEPGQAVLGSRTQVPLSRPPREGEGGTHSFWQCLHPKSSSHSYIFSAPCPCLIAPSRPLPTGPGPLGGGKNSRRRRDIALPPVGDSAWRGGWRAAPDGPRCWRTALSPTAARRASWPGARAGRGRAARGPPGPPVLPGWHPLFLQCSSSPPRGTSWATSWSSSPCSGTASCGTRVSVTPASRADPSLKSDLHPHPFMGPRRPVPFSLTSSPS